MLYKGGHDDTFARIQFSRIESVACSDGRRKYGGTHASYLARMRKLPLLLMNYDTTNSATVAVKVRRYLNKLKIPTLGVEVEGAHLRIVHTKVAMDAGTVTSPQYMRQHHECTYHRIHMKIPILMLAHRGSAMPLVSCNSSYMEATLTYCPTIGAEAVLGKREQVLHAYRLAAAVLALVFGRHTLPYTHTHTAEDEAMRWNIILVPTRSRPRTQIGCRT